MARWERSVEKESFWREVMGRQGTSGLSVREFCRAESLKESAFHFWRRTLAARDGRKRNPVSRSRRPKRAAKLGFVPAVIRPPAAEASFVLELAGGRVLKLPSSTPVANLVELVLALEHRGNR